jgi:hypothetical protein
MTYWLNDWVVSAGYIEPLMILMAVTVAFSVIGIAVMMKYGKTFRRWTRNSKLHSWKD